MFATFCNKGGRSTFKSNLGGTVLEQEKGNPGPVGSQVPVTCCRCSHDSCFRSSANDVLKHSLVRGTRVLLQQGVVHTLWQKISWMREAIQLLNPKNRQKTTNQINIWETCLLENCILGVCCCFCFESELLAHRGLEVYANLSSKLC